jgi:hypothetical protein
VHQRFLAQHGALRQHPVEVGTEPVGQIIGLDRPAKPPRMEATGNSVANLDTSHPVANRSDLTSSVGKRHDAELCRTTTAALEDIRSR